MLVDGRDIHRIYQNAVWAFRVTRAINIGQTTQINFPKTWQLSQYEPRKKIQPVINRPLTCCKDMANYFLGEHYENYYDSQFSNPLYFKLFGYYYDKPLLVCRGNHERNTRLQMVRIHIFCMLTILDRITKGLDHGARNYVSCRNCS
jgi:hypothetical protein